MDSSTPKAQLRSRIRSARADRARAEVAPGSRGSVAAAAWDVIDARPVRSLLAYAALAGEPDLDPAIDRFLTGGGTVFLPVVTKVGEPLAFGKVTGSMAGLEPQGRWGIREPQADTALLTPEQLLSDDVGLDLIFVPALGFGADGARLGNGGGFYDRTFGPHGAAPLRQAPASRRQAPTSLRQAPAALRQEPAPLDRGAPPHRDVPRVVGVCFASELALSGLVAEDWDLRIPTVVTENGLHVFDAA